MPKFTPKKPLTMYREGERPSKDSLFLDSVAAEHVRMGGVVVYAWLQEGVFDQKTQSGQIASQLDEQLDDETGEPLIQDAVLMENRDRKYSEDAVKLWGAYAVSQNALDFARFGMLSSDVIQMDFHKNEMEKQCGRRLRPGDVIELSNVRDVGLDGRPMNRWYEIRNILRTPKGYDHTYDFHLLTATMRPVRDAQEFIDLMERETFNGSTLRDEISNAGFRDAVTAKNQQTAFEQSYTTWWDTTQIYIDEESARPYRWTDDATPPNGKPVDKVSSFPGNPNEGDYVVRVDAYPNKLYRYESGKWVMKEVDRKREWNTYNWVAKLREFATDQSESDDLRPWQYVSIHDVQTPRHGRSDPSPRGKSHSPEVPDLGSWSPLVPSPKPPQEVIYQNPDPVTYTVNLSPTATPASVHAELSAQSGKYAVFHVQYSIAVGSAVKIGELLVTDSGLATQVQHESTNLSGSVDIVFSVRHDSGMRLMEYTLSGVDDAVLKFRVDDKW